MRRLDQPSDGPAHRPRAELGVEAALRRAAPRRAASLTSSFTPRAASSSSPSAAASAAPTSAHVAAGERREGEHLVDPVVELGRAARAAPRATTASSYAPRPRASVPCAAEADPAARAPLGRATSAPRFEVMRMTTFVKSIVRPRPSVSRPSSKTWRNASSTSRCAFSISSRRSTWYGRRPHRLGELPARLVPDVAGGRADEAGDGVRLGVLGEVEAGHRVRGSGRGTRRSPWPSPSCRRRSGRAGGTSRSGASRGSRKRSAGAPRDARERARVADDAARRAAPRAAACARRRVSRRRSSGTPGISVTTSAICSAADLLLRPPAPARAPARSRMPTALSGSARPGQVARAPRDARRERLGAERDAVVLAERGDDCSSARKASSADSSTTSMAVKRRASAASGRTAACSRPRWSRRRCTRAPPCASAILSSVDLLVASLRRSTWMSSRKSTTRPSDLRHLGLDLHDALGEGAAHARPARGARSARSR